ncbi:MAG: SPOR domain-containing protein [Candidatus Thiodiazotropha sp.]
MALEERLKQRLLGGAVLVALVVIFVPMLIEEPVERTSVSDYKIPAKPAVRRPLPEAGSQQDRKIEQHQVATPAVKPDSKPASEPTPEPTPEPKPAPVKESTPPAAEPKHAPRSSPARPSPTAWVIQVASLTNENNAKKLVEQLRKADLPAQMEKVKLNGKQHYRIRVGPEVDHRLAEKMAAKIKKRFKLNPKLMQYPVQ